MAAVDRLSIHYFGPLAPKLQRTAGIPILVLKSPVVAP
jgi:hypothetical protein